MRRNLLIVLVSSMIWTPIGILIGVANSQPTLTTNKPSQSSVRQLSDGPSFVSKDQLVFGVNSVRQNVGLNPLLENSKLDKIALDKANDMCSRDYADHNAPDGRSWTYFYLKDGYYYQSAGENLAEGFSDPYSTVNAWVASPEHYSNIVNKNYTEAGAASISCANYQGKTNQTISVNEFGEPIK